jgi:4-amino-4-deoxy-L-arabinose transferase-like glycosyltransferase
MTSQTGPTGLEVREQQRQESTPTQTPFAFWTSVLAIVGCGLVASYLMYTNLSYGLPFFYHADEPDKVVAAMNLARGSVPSKFRHPHFMLFFAIPFISIGGWLGVHPLLAARAAVATLGVATVCLLFVVGRSLAGRLAGFGAALLYATAPLAVVAAHDFKEDTPLAFWLTVQIYFLVRYLRDAHSRDLFLAAGALGAAMGTKYPGVIGVPLLAGAGWFGPQSNDRWKRLAGAAFVAAAGFVLATASILWHPADFLDGVSYEARHAIVGHMSPRPIDGNQDSRESWNGSPLQQGRGGMRISAPSHLWTYHLRHSLVPGISIAGVLLVLVGAFMAVTRRDRAWWLVAAGLGIFYLVHEMLPLKPPPFAARYMVAVLPYAALLVGGAVAFSWENGFARKVPVALLFAATLIFNGMGSLHQVAAMRPDTRDQAREWVAKNIPHGARLILPGSISYTPFRGSYLRRDFPYDVVILERDSYSELMTESSDPRAYLMIASFSYQRYLDFPDLNPDMSRFYRVVFERFTPLATFSVPFRSLGFHNPTIQIFRLSETPHSSPPGR